MATLCVLSFVHFLLTIPAFPSPASRLKEGGGGWQSSLSKDHQHSCNHIETHTHERKKTKKKCPYFVIKYPPPPPFLVGAIILLTTSLVTVCMPMKCSLGVSITRGEPVPASMNGEVFALSAFLFSFFSNLIIFPGHGRKHFSVTDKMIDPPSVVTPGGSVGSGSRNALVEVLQNTQNLISALRAQQAMKKGRSRENSVQGRGRSASVSTTRSVRSTGTETEEAEHNTQHQQHTADHHHHHTERESHTHTTRRSRSTRSYDRNLVDSPATSRPSTPLLAHYQEPRQEHHQAVVRVTTKRYTTDAGTTVEEVIEERVVHPAPSSVPSTPGNPHFESRTPPAGTALLSPATDLFSDTLPQFTHSEDNGEEEYLPDPLKGSAQGQNVAHQAQPEPYHPVRSMLQQREVVTQTEVRPEEEGEREREAEAVRRASFRSPEALRAEEERARGAWHSTAAPSSAAALRGVVSDFAKVAEAAGHSAPAPATTGHVLYGMSQENFESTTQSDKKYVDMKRHYINYLAESALGRSPDLPDLCSHKPKEIADKTDDREASGPPRSTSASSGTSSACDSYDSVKVYKENQRQFTGSLLDLHASQQGYGRCCTLAEERVEDELRNIDRQLGAIKSRDGPPMVMPANPPKSYLELFRRWELCHAIHPQPAPRRVEKSFSVGLRIREASTSQWSCESEVAHELATDYPSLLGIASTGRRKKGSSRSSPQHRQISPKRRR